MSNVAASVRARLTNHAERVARPFDEIFQNYALERFLYRLAQSPHGDRFVLKGALLFKAWGTAAARPTRDIDLLGFVANEVSLIESMVRDVCALPVEGVGRRRSHGPCSRTHLSYQGTHEEARRVKIPQEVTVAMNHPVPWLPTQTASSA